MRTTDGKLLEITCRIIEPKFNDLPAKAGRLFYGINAAIQAKAR